MALLERVQADMVAAMKAKNDARLNAIRMIKAALQKHQVDTMKPLDDAAERVPIQSYMPAEATESEIAQAVDAAPAETGITSAKQMGVVMKATQAKLAGKRADGKALS